ncbi:hypothetical protein WJM97_00920 [Okeanomitos corallinicola TIOX110]|uniref:Uncharacterized protein n=1 Tax=Okeanomitos corallinicola TIOX110 TaxID=3133117 RepID=A0ABZ2USB9_9CYAN
MGVKASGSPKLRETNQQYSQKVLLDCVVKDSESAKPKIQAWKPGSDQAQFGVKAGQKLFN